MELGKSRCLRGTLGRRSFTEEARSSSNVPSAVGGKRFADSVLSDEAFGSLFVFRTETALASLCGISGGSVAHSLAICMFCDDVFRSRVESAGRVHH